MRTRTLLLRTIGVLVAALALAIGALVGFMHIAPERALHVAMDLEHGRAGLVRREITLSDGLHYVYLEGGQGEPLVLLHGFGADKDNFTRVARFLTPHFRVIVPDQLGFGESAHPPQADYSPEAQAQRLQALMQALGVRKPHLGGSSMGGHIALAYAAAHPDDTQSLWLIDSAGVWSGPESELAQMIRTTGSNPLMARTEEEFAATYAFAMSDPPFIPRPLLDVVAHERMRNHALETKIFQQIAGDSVESRIGGLKTPTLILWGEQDRAIHVGTAQVLHRLLPNSRVVIMPGVGHLPMVERPKESAQEYLRFRGVS